MKMGTVVVDQQSIDLKGKVKDRKKIKKSSPREQPLSPISTRVEGSGIEEMDDKNIKDEIDRNGRKHEKNLSSDNMTYIQDISTVVSPSDSISSIHDAQSYNDRIRCLESEKLSIMIEHNNLMKEFNRMMESHLEEVRNLKDGNMQLEQEVADLKDLSVFLDDDRRKCRRLAKEWQRFGRHTVSVMRNEVMGYQEKVRTLETKQTELIKENSELRDLCVYLDNQRSGLNGTDSDSPGPLNYVICQECSLLKKNQGGDASRQGIMKSSFRNNYTAEQVLDLQNQILQLEKEKDSLHKLLMFGGKSRREKKRVSFSVPTDEEYDSSSTASEVDRLDFPPSFGGSNENFNTILEANSVMGRNGPPTGLQNHKLSDISPRNNDLIRLHHHNGLPLSKRLSEQQINEIRGKLSRSTTGETTLSEYEINMMKQMCNINSVNKDRRGSNPSLNNSFDQSPLCAPPQINGVPLYDPNGTNENGNQPKFKETQQKNDKVVPSLQQTPDSEEIALPSYDELMTQAKSKDETEVREDDKTATEKTTNSES